MEGKTGTSTPELVESGVDYLTATCNRDRAGRRLAALADSVLLSEKGKGNFMKDWRWEGYRGYHCGSIQTGVRDDGLIIRLSSYLANQHAAKVVQLATNVSRIDLQVTVRVESEKTDLSAKHGREAIRHKRARNTKLEVQHIRVDGGGSTLYLGRRVSDYFFRCYDKYHESQLDHYKNCWRNELELKGGAAKHMWESLITSEDHQLLARSAVATYLTKRGIRPLWSNNAFHTFVSAVRSTSAEDRLRWLSCQVKKSVQVLIEAGYGLETLEALGLTSEVLSNMVDRKTGPVRIKGGDRNGSVVPMHSRTGLLVSNF